jgi:hypothetical protein
MSVKMSSAMPVLEDALLNQAIRRRRLVGGSFSLLSCIEQL